MIRFRLYTIYYKEFLYIYNNNNLIYILYKETYLIFNDIQAQKCLLYRELVPTL